jgi:YHS domain-containing protein
MKTILALASLGVLLAGCESGPAEANRSTHTWKSNQGAFALDHVSQNRIESSKAVTRSYLGETYYFENEENARKFDAKPWAYLYDHNNPERSSSPGTQGVSND